MKVAIVAIATATLALSGCETMKRGADEDFQVISQPAGAQVQTSNGYSCANTPCTIKMPRNAAFTTTISKQGCKTTEVQVGHHRADISETDKIESLAGGLTGMVIDDATGANLDLSPNPVNVKLQCGA